MNGVDIGGSYMVVVGFILATMALFGALWKIYKTVRIMDTRLTTMGQLLDALGPDRTIVEFVDQHDSQHDRLIIQEKAIAETARRIDHHGELLDEVVANTTAMRGAMEHTVERFDDLETWVRTTIEQPEG